MTTSLEHEVEVRTAAAELRLSVDQAADRLREAREDLNRLEVALKSARSQGDHLLKLVQERNKGA